jgi:hypothetical protein
VRAAKASGALITAQAAPSLLIAATMRSDATSLTRLTNRTRGVPDGLMVV